MQCAMCRSNRYNTLPVNREHLLSVAENPLLVRVGGEVIGGCVVRRHVVEEPAVLRPHKLYKPNLQLPEIVQIITWGAESSGPWGPG